MKTQTPQWFDLFGRRGTRRDFLRVGAGAAGLVALGALPGCGRGRGPRLSADPFRLGVASGDPSPEGLVLWSRLDRTPLAEAGVGSDPFEVGWEIASDEGFSSIVRRGTALALDELGRSVHVEADGLEPGRVYHYRFHAGGVASPAGRARTAPAAGAAVDEVRFAFASCQHYETGWYTALAHLAEEDVDFVAHLGDYIYEGGPNPRVRAHEGPEVRTLEAYRARYETYRSDADLQAAHAAAAWIVTTDDHEVDNDYAGGVPEDDQDPAAFLLRRAAAYQAFYEFMPVRRTVMPAGPDMALYRRLAFGDLLDVSVLDTRQYRSDQPCGGPFTCDVHQSEEQTILGARQRAWLFERLASSSARWNVLAQQVLVARLRNVQNDRETWAMDKWDGYPREREALLRHLGDRAVPNPVVLTGDIHSNWVADLHTDFEDERSPVVGTEFAGTSISSGGDGAPTRPAMEEVLSRNPHIRFYNGQRGYVRVRVTPGLWTSDYRIVPTVSTPGGPVETAATFVVEDGRPGAQRA